MLKNIIGGIIHMEKKETKFTVDGFTDEGDDKISVTVKGVSEMPFWHHDLKIEAALALLETVDKKDFYEDNQEELFYKYMDRLREKLEFLQF